VFDMMVM